MCETQRSENGRDRIAFVALVSRSVGYVVHKVVRKLVRTSGGNLTIIHCCLPHRRSSKLGAHTNSALIQIGAHTRAAPTQRRRSKKQAVSTQRRRPYKVGAHRNRRRAHNVVARTTTGAHTSSGAHTNSAPTQRQWRPPHSRRPHNVGGHTTSGARRNRRRPYK